VCNFKPVIFKKSEMQNIFVYGTLQSELIINKLTRKKFHSSPAILRGYKRYRVKDCDYPAIVAEAGSETKGLILFNVKDSDLHILSFYEGDEYEKKTVTVLLNDKPTDVLAFVWLKGVDLLENKEWNLHQFQEDSLEHYLNIVVPETLVAFQKND
jgi:gamma-glutamylcyclotransferase (GGCT)/AIG2-like uncharacterized protein YtfP